MPVERAAERRYAGVLLLLVSVLATVLWLVLLVVSAYNSLVVGLGVLLLLALNPRTRPGGRSR
jgi:hypothetical protein